jgi:Arc/MetJ family transcription regulator
MRTNIDFDEDLLAATMKETGQKTKKGAVEEAMRHYVIVKRQMRAFEALKGIGWEGDLDEMRRDREFDEHGNRLDRD